ncbi:MAG: hypothetical protein JST89_23115 [Cyanobacteria bacterium SZAS-4]|nr:hypothetical protein [Cyanobacteria bacterium SZAS-4]
MKPICTVAFMIFIGLVGIRVYASDSRPPIASAEKTGSSYFVPACTPEQRACSLLEIPQAAVARFTGEPNKSVDLKSYSITLDVRGKRIPAYVPAFEPETRTTRCGWSSRQRRFSYTSYFPVTRPGETNFVAVIKTVSDGPTVLNPVRGFDYGPIPLLTSLTVEQADALWGKAIKEKTASELWQQKTYQLDSININGIQKTFLLDCSFKNGRLSGYAISGRGIKNNRSPGVMDERIYGLGY